MAIKMENRVGLNFAIFRSNPWRQFTVLLEICVKTLIYMKVWKTKFPIFGSIRLKISEPVTYDKPALFRFFIVERAKEGLMDAWRVRQKDKNRPVVACVYLTCTL